MRAPVQQKDEWLEVRNRKVHTVVQQLASLQLWVEKSGGNAEILEQISTPYYQLLDSIYQDHESVASALAENKIPAAFAPTKGKTKKKAL